MTFSRFLLAGAVVSLVLHGTGAAYFAKDPDDVSIAASQGGGVSVIGSLEDLVAGVQVEIVSETRPVEEIEPDPDPLEPVTEPVKMTEVPPDTAVKPVEIASVQPAAAAPVVAGVTSADPVTAAKPVETVQPEATPPTETVPEAPETVRPVEAVQPTEPQQDRTPVEIARVEPPVSVEPVKPVSEVLRPVEDPLQDVTETPRTKPKPPFRTTRPKKTPDKKLKTAQTRGAEASSRKGGERVTSKTARSNSNGRKDSKSTDGGTRATSNYKGKILAKLRRAKRYPRQARRENLSGTVQVAFTISRSGAVSGIRVVRSSGQPVLDQAALDMVRRAAPMPKFPAGMTVGRLSLQVPVRFSR
ncbi:energy transducer TonB [Labrenzia sp. 011]|uniref:energy transducer TonB n=1 Tax=Labrenzia sp. 011 TaxID=2171494 RepID=UPI000D51CECD|nr:energy transducer TonB [Labrenzia sp. 011]PVB62397.1 hypothetical protein DCO57_06455 [Labrenzia sp. 011]